MRTPVILLAGLDDAAISRTAPALLRVGTVLVHHDLTWMTQGLVTRTVRTIDGDGKEIVHLDQVTLDHGCLSCAMRDDLLPLLRRLHRRSNVGRIVLQLDSTVEPEAVAWAIEHVLVCEMPGFLDAPAGADVRIEATVTCVAEMDWLDAAAGDITMAELGRSTDDDERTLAQVAVGQVAFADALVIASCDAALRDSWQSARLMAVLKRLSPGAPMIMETPNRQITPTLAAALLDNIGHSARRGRIDGPHDPLLRGYPPLESDCGVELFEFTSDRPFHPDRLHDALDHLLDGVVQARGRLWLATRPDESLWLESAGGGLRVADGGAWIAAMDEESRKRVDPERLAMAALRWHDTYGDRHSSIVVLIHRADREEVTEALRKACLSAAEFGAGQQFWMMLDDPFGISHQDPCEDKEATQSPSPETTVSETNQGKDKP